MADKLDIIRKHMPDLAAHFDRLDQAGEMLAQENDAKVMAELAERQKMAQEQAELERRFKDDARDKFPEGGWGPKVVGGHWTRNKETNEPMWSGADYENVRKAVAKS